MHYQSQMEQLQGLAQPGQRLLVGLCLPPSTSCHHQLHSTCHFHDYAPSLQRSHPEYASKFLSADHTHRYIDLNNKNHGTKSFHLLLSSASAFLPAIMLQEVLCGDKLRHLPTRILGIHFSMCCMRAGQL